MHTTKNHTLVQGLDQKTEQFYLGSFPKKTRQKYINYKYNIEKCKRQERLCKYSAFKFLHIIGPITSQINKQMTEQITYFDQNLFVCNMKFCTPIVSFILVE